MGPGLHGHLLGLMCVSSSLALPLSSGVGRFFVPGRCAFQLLLGKRCGFGIWMIRRDRESGVETQF